MSKSYVEISYNELRAVLAACDAETGIRFTEKHHFHISNNLWRSGITDRRELAMFLANVLHQSECLTVVRDPCYLSRSCWHAGREYYGRGYLPIVGHCMYYEASKAIYNDDRLYLYPEMVADDVDITWVTTMWWWKTRVHDESFVRRERISCGDFQATIEVIEPTEVQSPTHTDCQLLRAARRQKFYRSIRDVLGVDC